jgi:porin
MLVEQIKMSKGYPRLLPLLVSIVTLLQASAAYSDQGLLNQPSIIDVPGGPKQALQEAGIDLSVYYTEFYQGLVSGEGDKSWEFGGKTDVLGKFDGHRLGLWQGLYVTAHAEFVNGSNVLFKGDGSVLPVNTALALPTLGGYDYDLSLVVTQAFSEQTSLSVGKFNMLDAASKTPLLGGGGINTFFNIALAAPVSGVTPPYIVGGILSYKTDPVGVTLMVYDPRNAQDPDVLRHPFEDGVTTSLSLTFPVTIAGRTGYQSIRGVYSTLNGTDFRDIPELILPGGDADLGTVDGYWFASYAFQQYLVQDQQDPSRGWGVFGQIAVSDGNPNPFGWSGFVGLGGSSLLPNRPDDTFGVSYFYYGFSNELKDSLAEVNYALRNESGIEAFYNVAVTPWLNLSADGQVISPAHGDETAFFLGMRAQVKVF